jgi:hypothetical protein
MKHPYQESQMKKSRPALNLALLLALLAGSFSAAAAAPVANNETGSVASIIASTNPRVAFFTSSPPV